MVNFIVSLAINPENSVSSFYDARVISAIIAAIVSIIGIMIGYYLQSRRDIVQNQKMDELSAKQQSFTAEIENLKLNNQKSFLEHDIKVRSNADEIKKLKDVKDGVLKKIQKIKDALYFIEKKLSSNNFIDINDEVDTFLLSSTELVNYYDENYIYLDDVERKMLHDLKNKIHSLILNFKIIKIDENGLKDQGRKNKVISDILNDIKLINVYQEWFLQYTI